MIIVGRWQGKISLEQQAIVEPKRSGFHDVEQIDIAEGWQQMVAGQWQGIGLIDVQDGQRDTWGQQILIADHRADRRKLQAHYPGMMIFTPAEFVDAVNDWPDNAATIQAKRIFRGDIAGGAA